MAQRKRQTLKTYFEVGDIPTQQQYHDWIESNVMLSDDNSGSIHLSGSINLVGINGNLTASQNISASGTIYAASFEPNIVTSGVVSSSAVIGTNNFGTNIVLDNNVFVQGRDLGGAAKELIALTNNNTNEIANQSYSTFLYGGDITADSLGNITLDAGGDINIDAAGDDVFFNKGGVTKAWINTNTGDITSSGHISASGNISSSTAFIGNSYTQTASLHTSGALSEVIFENLPTSKPSTIGSLWLGDSDTAGTSKQLMVVTS